MSSELVNVLANAAHPSLQLQLAHDWQVSNNNSKFKPAAISTRDLPVNELGLERVAEFLRSGSNQGGNRAAEA